MKKNNLLFFLGFIFILLVGIFLIQYYFNFQNNLCQKDPFVFGSQRMEANYDANFSGYGYLIANNGVINTFNFNPSSSYWVK